MVYHPHNAGHIGAPTIPTLPPGGVWSGGSFATAHGANIANAEYDFKQLKAGKKVYVYSLGAPHGTRGHQVQSFQFSQPWAGVYPAANASQMVSKYEAMLAAEAAADHGGFGGFISGFMSDLAAAGKQAIESPIFNPVGVGVEKVTGVKATTQLEAGAAIGGAVVLAEAAIPSATGAGAGSAEELAGPLAGVGDKIKQKVETLAKAKLMQELNKGRAPTASGPQPAHVGATPPKKPLLTPATTALGGMSILLAVLILM